MMFLSRSSNECQQACYLRRVLNAFSTFIGVFLNKTLQILPTYLTGILKKFVKKLVISADVVTSFMQVFFKPQDQSHTYKFYGKTTTTTLSTTHVLSNLWRNELFLAFGLRYPTRFPGQYRQVSPFCANHRKESLIGILLQSRIKHNDVDAMRLL